MSICDPIQDSRCASNSAESNYNAQASHHQDQTAALRNEVQVQRPEDLVCNYAHSVSDEDMRVGICVPHDKLCNYLGNWDSDTERQLEELLMKYLESICDDAVKKVASCGHSIEEAGRAVLRVGSQYRVKDVLPTLGEKASLYLASNNPDLDETELIFSDLKELHKFILAEMVRALRDERPFLKKGDALWCLIVSDMNMAQACKLQDASSSLNSSVTSVPSTEACLPAAITSLQPPNYTICMPLTAKTIESSAHHASNLNARVKETRSFSEQIIRPRDPHGLQSPVRLHLPDGQLEACLLTCVESTSEEHKSIPDPLKTSSSSLIALKSAASLCSTLSECCHEDTALSIGPPVRSTAQPCSPSKVATKNILDRFSSRGRGKHFEGWELPSTSSVIVQPMQQSSPDYSRELPLQKQCTSCSCCASDGFLSDLDRSQNMQLALGSAQLISPNDGLEMLQPGSNLRKTSKVSSCRTFSRSQLSNGAVRVNECNLTAAGKELSLAIASAVDFPKTDGQVTAADESIFDSNKLVRELNSMGIPDGKGQLVEELLNRVKDLEATLQERSKWAREKVAHAANRLIKDFSELKALRLEREEASRLRKEKEALEESSKKKISDMEIALRKTIGQAECTNAVVRRLEIENAEMRAEMEATKLSAAESAANDKVVAKREKKALKKEKSWETQRVKLQAEIALEKRKFMQSQLDVSQLKEEQQAAEVRWRQEVKEKQAAMNLAESERRAKEQVEAAAKKSEDSLRRKADADNCCHQDDIARLEDEIAHLSLTKDSSKQTLLLSEANLGVTSVSKYTQSMQELRNINSRLLQELADVQSSSGQDLQRDRECVMCMSEERSVVFLPCAHQIVCVECNDSHKSQGMKDCPSCRTFIEQRIRVYGAKA
ncbi:hypothetical protein O6H91_10G051500 [Diphasiastrum complanatum]|nr:hypothetical protein O6H91_10G051500 [Diphasiastrum complanatum]KAJ7541262.1 hypothetical protein O6H91_10G051500 [Diphasiastrum complanatum]